MDKKQDELTRGALWAADEIMDMIELNLPVNRASIASIIDHCVRMQAQRTNQRTALKAFLFAKGQAAKAGLDNHKPSE